ncbi:MAG: hypothetical protein LBN24_06265 [Mediterranea sp.]|jgi:hypothetical protein|nr:hypothetical protein [Mediterranea sp.]
MKTMNLKQMEDVQGGGRAMCVVSMLGLVASFAGFVATGSVGLAAWGALAGFGLDGASFVSSCSGVH